MWGVLSGLRQLIIRRRVSLTTASEAGEQQVNGRVDRGLNGLWVWTQKRIDFHQIHSRQETCIKTRADQIISFGEFVKVTVPVG